VLLIGPEYLSIAIEHFGMEATNYKHIKIPEKDCFKYYNDILANALKALNALKPGDVVLVCASMMAEPLIMDLQAQYPDMIYLDMGSVLEPYAGKNTRSYHQKIIDRI